MSTVFFKTFGCKLNQTETESIAQDFRERGYRVISNAKQADVVVVNSCTVTQRTDAKCRQSIRHMIRVNPDATVIVVGCYAQVASEMIAKIPGVDYILGTCQKSKLFDYFPRIGKLSHPRITVTPVKGLHNTMGHRIEYFGQTRAFLKIQDGCSDCCSYCIVPFARGPSRSVPLEQIIQQAERFVANGYREIVLTGVHIGRYGQDFNPSLSLSKLLIRLLQIQGIQRIRLSSLDPGDITDELLDVVSGDKRCCPHFHIPLQSGSDVILSAMRRNYTTSIFLEKIEKIQAIFGYFGLGTDVIVGFPGETERLFNETVQFIEGLPLGYLHVFPYSVREGTYAARLPNHLSSSIRAERARQLRNLGQRKKIQFMKKWVGQFVDVLLETRNQKGWMGGFSSEYLRVEVPYQETLINRLVSVKIQKVMHSSVRGKVIKNTGKQRRVNPLKMIE